MSMDGFSSNCAIASKSGQVKLYDLKTMEVKFYRKEFGIKYMSILTIKGLILIGDSIGYLRIFDYINDKQVDLMKF